VALVSPITSSTIAIAIKAVSILRENKRVQELSEIAKEKELNLQIRYHAAIALYVIGDHNFFLGNIFQEIAFSRIKIVLQNEMGKPGIYTDIRLISIDVLRKLERTDCLTLLANSPSANSLIRIAAIKALQGLISPSKLLKTLNSIEGSQVEEKFQIAQLYIELKNIPRAIIILKDIILFPFNQNTRESPEASPQIRAIKQLISFGKSGKLADIILNSKVDDRVRLRAVELLIESNTPTNEINIERILAALAKNKKFGNVIRYNALLNLLKIGHASDTVLWASDILWRETENELNRCAVDILIELHEVEILKKVALSISIDPDIRVYILRKLTRFGNVEEIGKDLLKLIHDESVRSIIRVRAIQLLLQIAIGHDYLELIRISTAKATPNTSDWPDLEKELFILCENTGIDLINLIRNPELNIFIRGSIPEHLKQKEKLLLVIFDNDVDVDVRLISACIYIVDNKDDQEVLNEINRLLENATKNGFIRQRAIGYLKNNDVLIIKGYQSLINNDYTEIDIKRASAIKLGNVFYKNKEYSQAESAYKKAIILGDDSAEVHLGIGNSYLLQNQHKNAIGEYRRYLELNPKAKDTCRVLGNCYTKLGNYKDAVKYYKQYLDEYNAKNIDVWADLSRAEMALGNQEGAAKAYVRLLELTPNLNEGSADLIEALVNLGKYGDAENILHKAYLKDSSNKHFYHEWIGQIRYLQQDPDGAIENLRIAFKLNPNCQSAIVKLAEILYLYGRESEAMSIIAEADNSAIETAQLQWIFGGFYFEKESLDVARKHFEKALELDPEFPQKLLNAVRLSFPGSKLSLERIYGVNINSAQSAESYSCLSIAIIFDFLERNSAYIGLIERATQLDPQNITAQIMLNSAYKRKRMYRKLFRNAVRRAFQSVPLTISKFEQNTIRLANKSFNGKKFRRALLYINFAVFINHKNPDSYNLKGILHRKLGHNLYAINAYEKALKIVPYAPDYLMNLIFAARIGKYHNIALAALSDLLQHTADPRVQCECHIGLAWIYDHLGVEQKYKEHIALAQRLVSAVPLYDRACFESINHDVDKALATLMEAIIAGEVDTDWIMIDPDLEELRQDQRFEDVKIAIRKCRPMDELGLNEIEQIIDDAIENFDNSNDEDNKS
jgi:tetratricopeptide (TPR) repeat protein